MASPETPTSEISSHIRRLPQHIRDIIVEKLLGEYGRPGIQFVTAWSDKRVDGDHPPEDKDSLKAIVDQYSESYDRALLAPIFDISRNRAKDQVREMLQPTELKVQAGRVVFFDIQDDLFCFQQYHGKKTQHDAHEIAPSYIDTLDHVRHVAVTSDGTARWTGYSISSEYKYINQFARFPLLETVYLIVPGLPKPTAQQLAENRVTFRGWPACPWSLEDIRGEEWEEEWYENNDIDTTTDPDTWPDPWEEELKDFYGADFFDDDVAEDNDPPREFHGSCYDYYEVALPANHPAVSQLRDIWAEYVSGERIFGAEDYGEYFEEWRSNSPASFVTFKLLSYAPNKSGQLPLADKE